jgi:hypothetical protein
MLLVIVGAICIFSIWWVVIPDDIPTKMREMGLAIVGCVAFGVIMVGAVWGLSYQSQSCSCTSR